MAVKNCVYVSTFDLCFMYLISRKKINVEKVDHTTSLSGKDAVIFLIDVSSPQMHQKREDNDTELQCALRVVYSTLKKKVVTFFYY